MVALSKLRLQLCNGQAYLQVSNPIEIARRNAVTATVAYATATQAEVCANDSLRMITPQLIRETGNKDTI